MNIYFCNINRINEEVEDFVIAKNKIEKPLIESEQLEKKMSIQEFLDFIDLSKSIFMFNDESNLSIPFSLNQPSQNDVVIIYSYDGKNEKQIELFKEKLEEMNYDFDSLTKLSQLELVQGVVANKPYFIINNEFYI